jgi:2,5-diamino-6-(ribosylamino)-4(3H)-pyrimidinone 5'-phosphate reductase
VPSSVITRPRLAIYNEISLDGRIEGFDQDASRYYQLCFRWRSDAILMGSASIRRGGATNQQAQTPPAPGQLQPRRGARHRLVSQPAVALLTASSSRLELDARA